MDKEGIVVHRIEEEEAKQSTIYLLDKAERDMLAIAEYLYFNDPKNRGKESAFNLVGISHKGVKDELRIIVGVGQGNVTSSPAFVRNPAETIEAIDEEARSQRMSVVGAGHLHPFPGGHRFLSQTDKETMKAYGKMDPAHVFVVLNPLTSEYAMYQWDDERNAQREIKPILIKTSPILVQERIAHQNASHKPVRIAKNLLEDSLMLLTASTSIAFIALFTLISASSPPLLIQVLIGTYGFLGLGMIYAIWRSIRRELKPT